MLNIMRHGMQSRSFKAIIFIFITLAVGSMVLSDVGGFFRGGSFGRNVVAKIGDAEITLPEFDQTYRQTLQQAQLPPEQAQAMKLPLIVLQQEASRQLVLQAAKKTGVMVSEKTIANMLAEQLAQIKGPETPAQKLQNALQQIGLSEAGLIAQMRADLAANIFQNASQYNVKTVPSLMPAAFYALRTEQRQALMVPLRARDVPMPKTPNDTTLQAYYKENASRYKTAETRDVDIFELSQTQMAAAAKLEDTDLAERTKALYADNTDYQKKPFAEIKPELEKQAASEALDTYLLSLNKNLDQAVAEGQSLANIAREYGGELKSLTNLSTQNSATTLGRLKFGDKATKKVLDTLNTLNSGETSPLIDTDNGGLLLVQIGKVTPSTLPSFAEKRQAVLADFVAQARADAAADLANTIIGAYDAKKPDAWQNLAKQKGLTIATLPNIKRGDTNPQVPTPVANLLFSLSAASPLSSTQINDETMLVFLNKITPSKAATEKDLTDTTSQLAQSFGQDAMQAFSQAWEKQIPAQLNQELLVKTYALPQ